MNFGPLISAESLLQQLRDGQTIHIFDCSFDLADPAAGERDFLQAHLPGARFADLERDLSAHPPQPAMSGGRHPLPTREVFAQWLGQQGVANGQPVVVYDRQGANFCGRLWWMLKWLGHAPVALLDGGLAAWQAAGGALASGPAGTVIPARFVPGEPLLRLVGTDEVLASLGGARTLIDARAPARYRGEVEPLDPVAGHIPGALNRPFGSNLTAEGRFKPADQLRAEFEQLLAGRDPATVIHHCGSGVSAIPNLVAMSLAGLPPGGLYAGSWSEWCRDPARPVARG